MNQLWYSGISYEDILTMIRNAIYLARMSPGSACKQSYHLGTYSNMKMSQTEKDLKLQMYSGMSCQDILTMIRNTIYYLQMSPGSACKQSYHVGMYNNLKIYQSEKLSRHSIHD